MVPEVVHYLRCVQGGLFVDGTLGTGGHTLALLQHSPATTKVIGIDRDPESLALARERLKSYSDRIHLIHGKFGELKEHLSRLGINAVNGILLDLGFSSFQIENPGRGFSFQREDLLDMRMDQTQGISAQEWLSKTSEKELVRVLQEFGEEKRSKKIATMIMAFQAKGLLRTTRDLAELISRSIPKGKRIHPATRTFQALRIQINDELTQLKDFLEQFLQTLIVGGRICLISYHSLEDRMIKQAFLRLERGVIDPLGMIGHSRPKGQPSFKRVTHKPVIPSQEEMKDNPRSRGAKLRVGERMEGES